MPKANKTEESPSKKFGFSSSFAKWTALEDQMSALNPFNKDRRPKVIRAVKDVDTLTKAVRRMRITQPAKHRAGLSTCVRRSQPAASLQLDLIKVLSEATARRGACRSCRAAGGAHDMSRPCHNPPLFPLTTISGRYATVSPSTRSYDAL
ncbi:uncharacterized protein SCHCODRAFT_02612741 [Schizophyllum commune H4-8]|uniref:uncharacterized protein n=1 Tax=Schizophyllum commune (strain H4-8 / FGSC 9210) TaxID=578458 RepID=UPI0021602305|nr:uncharacterized protein SCHCODRAFT_02612741 [Schizophyllum commune H4-8]KAI5898646.1 hypothetical protein SCHCODRAFT_02612741 [Schizophyllum commune H4-8]